MPELIVLLFIGVLVASLVALTHGKHRVVLDEPQTLNVQNDYDETETAA